MSPFALAPYGWPLAPFDRMHPIRAYLNDPRISGASEAFHFGVDISAPDGTAIHAVSDGTVHLEGPQNIAVAQSDGARVFGYWHVVPAVTDQQAVHRGDLLGHIATGWQHVHFAEHVAGPEGGYLNPLRARALTPFRDSGSPRIQRIVCARGGKELDPLELAGAVDVIVEAYDRPPLPVPPPWANMPVAPAQVRWRVMQGRRAVRPWHTPIDLGKKMLPKEQFGTVYAPGTRANHPNAPGLFRYIVAHTWSTRLLPDADYRIEAEASDLHGNRASSVLPIRILNQV